MQRLRGRVALVSGAGTGIGRGVVERFASEGACVVVLGRRADRLELVRDATGDAVEVVAGDVTRYEDCLRAVDAALTRWGRLDVVVSNAGVYDARAQLSDTDPETLEPAYEALFGVNVKGSLLLARAAVEQLAAVHGSLIFTASISGLAAGFGGALYVPSKHAVIGLARQLALELAGRVRVNAVALGYVATELSVPDELGGGRVLGAPEDVARRIPTGRAPQPRDVAGVYALLASDLDGSAMTGSVIVVDGGQTLYGPGQCWDE